MAGVQAQCRASAHREQADRPRVVLPVVVVAIGRRDPEAELSEPLAAREQAPRTRQPLAALLLSDPTGAERAA